MSGPNTFPSSTLQLGSLQEPETPSLLDLRSLTQGLQGRDSWLLSQAFEQIQASFDNLQQTLRSASPSLQYLQIDAADIGELYVGSEFGPGQLAVFGGPPSYAGAGWIGTALDAAPISITDITAGVVTTGADHNLKVNAAVLIEGTATNDGYYIVSVVGSATTFEVDGGFAGNSTGGEMTRLFQGGWLAQFAAGGTFFGDAPLRIDVDGALLIDDATITLTSANGTILLDPTIPALTVDDADGNTWATLEILTESPQSITAATNASPSVVTIVGHGYVNGDTALIAGATGNTAINGYRIVQNTTADTFTLTDMDGVAINGNGVYAGSGTATRYYGGGLFQTIAIGESFGNYKLRAFADGSLKILDADILLTGANGEIHIDPAEPAIRIIGTGGEILSLDPADSIEYSDGVAFDFRLGKDVLGPAGSTIRGLVIGDDSVIGTVTSPGSLPTTAGGCVICYTTTDSNALIDTQGLFVTGPASATGWFTYNAVEFTGVQVLSTRKAGLTATIAGVGFAPALYNQVYEQTLANLGNNLKTRVDELEARLGSATGHGLFT
jgi:hypothetical protein